MKNLKKKWWIIILALAIIIASIVLVVVLKGNDKEDETEQNNNGDEEKVHIVEKEDMDVGTYAQIGREMYEEYLTEETDSDKDGLPDISERDKHGTSPFMSDTDSDGLDDNSEINTYKTNPKKADTDGDGLIDGDEILAGLDPLKEKTDGDKNDGKITFEKNYIVDGLSMDIKGDASIYNVYVDKFTLGSGGNTRALVSPIYEFYKDGKFDEATITITYSENNLADGADEKELSICQYTDEGKWVKVDSKVNTDKNTVTATLEHFSKYAVLDLSQIDEQAKINVMIVIDDSGSMYPADMCEGSIESDVDFKRLEMVNSLVKELDDDVNVGAAYFTGDYNKCCDMGSTDEEIAKAMEDIKNSTTHNFNGTAILKSLDAALKEFPEGSVDANFIVILTDGESTEGGLGSLFATYSRDSVVEEAIRKNVKIITIGLGGGVKAEYLQDFSDNTNGRYVYANNAYALSHVYDKLKDVINDTYIDNDRDGVVDEVLVADSGFDMRTEALSFHNPILKGDGKVQLGICAGIAIFEQLNHSGGVPANLGHFYIDDYDLWGFRAITKLFDINGAGDNVALTYVEGYTKDMLENLGFKASGNDMVMENVKNNLKTNATYEMTKFKEMDVESKVEGKDGVLVYKDSVLEKHITSPMISTYVLNRDYEFKGVVFHSHETLIYDTEKAWDEDTLDLFKFFSRLYVEQFDSSSYDEYTLNKDFDDIVNLIKSGKALYVYVESDSHAINAVKITRSFDNTNLYYLYTYDNNNPNDLVMFTIEKTGEESYNVTNASGNAVTMSFRDYSDLMNKGYIDVIGPDVKDEPGEQYRYTYYEAEAANIGGGTTNEGTYIGWLGSGSYAEFTNVEVKTSGTYYLALWCLTKEARDTYVSINGGEDIIVKCPAGKSYTDNPTCVYVKVELKQGENTIKLTNPNGYAPNIDKIGVSMDNVVE